MREVNSTIMPLLILFCHEEKKELYGTVKLITLKNISIFPNQQLCYTFSEKHLLFKYRYRKVVGFSN